MDCSRGRVLHVHPSQFWFFFREFGFPIQLRMTQFLWRTKSAQDTCSNVLRFEDMEQSWYQWIANTLCHHAPFTVKSRTFKYHEICWGLGLCDLTVATCTYLYLYLWTVIPTCQNFVQYLIWYWLVCFQKKFYLCLVYINLFCHN